MAKKNTTITTEVNENLNAAFNAASATPATSSAYPRVITATIKRFGDSTVVKGRKAIGVSEYAIDELLGVPALSSVTYYVVPGVDPMLKPYIGLRCEITINVAPKMPNVEYVSNIKLLQKKVWNDDGSYEIVDIEQKGGNN